MPLQTNSGGNQSILHGNIGSITYYDFADLNFSSFYLTGFLQNRQRFNYRFSVSHSTPSLLRDSTMDGEWRKTLFAICLFKARIASEEYYFCIDGRDSATTKTGMGYHLPLLKKVRYYFKVNYNLDAINNDPTLRTLSDKIIPTAPFFPVAIPRFLPLLPRITPCKTTDWTFHKTCSSAKRQYSLVPLHKIRRLRHVVRDVDVFFVIRYYGHHSETAETRCNIVRELKNSAGINAITGLISSSKLPSEYEGLGIDRVRQKEFLANLSRAKLGIYVRGPHDCISFKFGELMALGKPIVGQKILNNRDIYYGYGHFNEQFSYETPREIVHRAVKLLAQPEKLAMLGKLNAHVFDTKFAPKPAVAAIVSKQLREVDRV